MRASRRLGCFFWWRRWGSASSRAPRAPRRQSARDILDELGLKKKAPAPPAGGPRRPPAEPATEEQKPEAPAGKAKSGGRTAVPAGPSFTRAIHPLFLATCKACHAAGAAAGATPLVLTGDAEADHRVLARFADVHAPETSKLLQKASGAALHGGGAPWPTASAPYDRVLAWIRAGARLDHAAAADEEAAVPANGEPAAHHQGDRHETRTPETAPSSSCLSPPRRRSPRRLHAPPSSPVAPRRPARPSRPRCTRS